MKNKLPKYDKYKPSGVEWLGEIPEHWEVKKLKYFFLEEESLFIDGDWIESKDIRGDEVKYITTGNIGEGFYKEQGDGFVTLETFKKLNCTEAKENDILISRLNVPLGRCCLCPKFEKKLIVSVDVAICRMDNNYVRKYFVYVMNSPFYQDFSEIESRGAIMKRISRTILGNFQLPIPPLTEQTRIAEFLDRKTAQIDQAIGIKEKQIALLKERRQIMIHRAVTRGIDPNVKLKPSGVEWIGDIPEHWEVKKVKHVTSKIGSGVTPSGGGTTYLDSGIPLLRSQNILFGKIELEGVAYISEKIHASMSNSQVKKGDVLLNVTGGSIGRCHFVDDDSPMNVNQHVCIVRPTKKITSIFLNSLLTSNVGQSQIWYFQQGGGREGLNFQAIKNFLLALPPIEEQKQIVTHIETLSSKIATAISLKEQEIEKLKEYKSVLINSAVTGKVKVG